MQCCPKFHTKVKTFPIPFRTKSWEIRGKLLNIFYSFVRVFLYTTLHVHLILLHFVNPGEHYMTYWKILYFYLKVTT